MNTTTLPKQAGELASHVGDTMTDAVSKSMELARELVTTAEERLPDSAVDWTREHVPGLGTRSPSHGRRNAFAIVLFVAALAGRAGVAYGLGTVLHLVGVRLPWPERHVLFWGGLRGAVALAAALSLPPDFPSRAPLLALTYGVVLFTILVQGLTIGPLVRRLGLVAADNTTTPPPEPPPAHS